MAQRKLLIVAGLATFIVGSSLMLPASVAYSLFAPATLKLAGVEGTIWRGRASAGTAGGSYFSDLSWSFQPRRIFAGLLAFDLALQTVAGPLSGDVAVGPGDKIVVEDLKGSFDISGLHPALMNLQIGGSTAIDFRRVTFRNGFPNQADGTINIANLVVGTLGTSPIGDFRAIVSDADGDIVALVEDTRAVVTLRGTLLLHDDRSYLFTGKVGATPDTPPQINQNLRFLGTPDANGQHDFRFEGTL